MRIPRRLPRWKSERHNRYFGALFHATPKWLSPEQIQEIYNIHRLARAMRRRGFKVHVDHIVPLLNPLVSGLNVPWNLRIVPKQVNEQKGNHYWPDMPFHQFDWLGCRETCEPHQQRLL